jgi:hypothetical protein
MLDRLTLCFSNKEPCLPESKHKALCGLSFLFPTIQRTFSKTICLKIGLLTVSLLSKQPIHHHSFSLPTLNPTGEAFFLFLSLK